MSWKRRILRSLLATAFTGLMYGLMLFGISGRFDLPVYWAYFVIALIVSVFGFVAIDPDLMRERRKPGKGGIDYLTVHLGKTVLTLHMVMSPLDVGRLHWSNTIPLWAQIVGLVVFTFGLALSIHCMVINRYFSTVVRIQSDRGHELISTGPYGVVRHPGYTGIVMLSIGSGLALGSWWGSVPALLFALMIIRRLLIEDRFLLERLDGYDEYAQRVPHRLVPGVW